MVVNVDSNKYDFLLMKHEVKELIENRTKPYSIDEIGKLFLKYEGNEIDKRLSIDQAFRDVLEQMLSETSNNTDRKDTSDIISEYQGLIDFVVIHSKEFCTKNLSILLLSDIFDTLTLEECEEMFLFVEKNVSIWTEEPFFSTGKNHLLRMCNDILRRLSKSQNTVFCGRIQLFLARLFPIEEKSALNLVSNFHLENITLYKNKESDFEQIQNDSMDTEDGELVANPVDFHLYSKFWSLQDYFRNPSKCYTKDGWNNVTTNVTEILKTFSSFKLEDHTRKRKTSETLTNTEQISKNIQNYFAKYLTNEKLFNLQLNDSNFRRYFLVQVLILFQYLTGTNKFKTPNQILNDNQNTWINETIQKVQSTIEETPPSGKKFYETVSHILNRDENWINWKNESCPSFAKQKIVKEKEVVPARRKKRNIGEDYVQNHLKRMNLGTAELSRLWNLNPDNLASAKDESRLRFLPQLESFFEEAIEQADPEAGIEDEYLQVKQPNFQWKALRLLARRSHHFFTPSTTPFKALPEYLNNVITNISKDIQKDNTVQIKQEPAENGEEMG